MYEVPPQLPIRNWPLTRWLGRLLLNVLGWRIEGPLPDLSKAVIAIAPHTSNWDFIIGMAAVWALDLRANWLGKQSLFTGFGGSLLLKLGGIPVDRSHPEGLLDQVVLAYQRQSQLLLGLTPEGTRKAVTPWKTGCCRIAHAAQIPLVPVALDYSQKQIRVLPHWIPDQDLAKNMLRLSQQYTATMAKNPAHFLADTPWHPGLRRTRK